jgi:hypothetical protein
MAPRHFPPPWTIEEHNNACFIVRDANRRRLAYAYFDPNLGRRTPGVQKEIGRNVHAWSRSSLLKSNR